MLALTPQLFHNCSDSDPNNDCATTPVQRGHEQVEGGDGNVLSVEAHQLGQHVALSQPPLRDRQKKRAFTSLVYD